MTNSKIHPKYWLNLIVKKRPNILARNTKYGVPQSSPETILGNDSFPGKFTEYAMSQLNKD